MSLWKPARNAPPPSADDLRANARPIRAEIEVLKENIRTIPDELSNLAGDPEEFARAQAALRDAQALLPIKEAALASIEAAIPAAENRGREAALRAEISEQRKRSNALKRDAETRYRKAVGLLAPLLTELERDNHAWDVLNMKCRELGLPMDASAEKELRGEIGMRPGLGWCSVTENIVVRDWSGRVLFGGTVGGYC